MAFAKAFISRSRSRGFIQREPEREPEQKKKTPGDIYSSPRAPSPSPWPRRTPEWPPEQTPVPSNVNEILRLRDLYNQARAALESSVSKYLSIIGGTSISSQPINLREILQSVGEIAERARILYTTGTAYSDALTPSSIGYSPSWPG